MIFNQHRQKGAAPSCSSSAVRSEQEDEAARLTIVDGNVLLLRLLLCFQTLHGKTSGIVEHVFEEVFEASKGLVFLHMLQRQVPYELPLPPHIHYVAPIHTAGRWYGSLAVKRDPRLPERAALTFAMSRSIAQCCALYFYNLEISALLQSMTPSRESPLEPLSRREQEVLELMCRGYERREIADVLKIAPRTLGKHYEHLYEQIGVRTERDVIIAAFALGLFYPLEELSPRVNAEELIEDMDRSFLP